MVPERPQYRVCCQTSEQGRYGTWQPYGETLSQNINTKCSQNTRIYINTEYFWKNIPKPSKSIVCWGRACRTGAGGGGLSTVHIYVTNLFFYHLHILAFRKFIYFITLFLTRLSCCLGWPQTLDLPANAFWVLGLQVCTTDPCGPGDSLIHARQTQLYLQHCMFYYQDLYLTL